MQSYDVAVIGAGLVGAAIGHDLSKLGVRTVVLEASAEPAAGASRSNSGVLHTGFDSKPGTLETTMIRAQAQRWPQLFDSLGIPYRIPGALLVATDEEQAARLSKIAENAEQNSVEAKPLDADDLRRFEPNASGISGLLIPGEAITDPYEVVTRLLGDGPEVRLNWPVHSVDPEGSGEARAAEIRGPGGSIAADYVVNCAGLYADEIAADNTFSIRPRRGEFAVFAEGTASMVNHILLPVPDERTKGVLVFPTIYGNLCAGPSAVDQEDKEDWRPRREHLKDVQSRGARMLQELETMEPANSWAGLRTSGEPENYLIEWSGRVPAMLNVAAIRSTGLSACLGISEYVTRLLAEKGLAAGRPSGDLPVPTAISTGNPRPWWERLNSLRGVEGPC